MIVKKVIYIKLIPHMDCTNTLFSNYILQNIFQKLQLTSSQNMYIISTEMPLIHKYSCDKIITYLPKTKIQRIFNCCHSFYKVPYLLKIPSILFSTTTSLYHVLDIKFIFLYLIQVIYLFAFSDHYFYQVPYLLTVLSILSSTITSLFHTLDIKFIILYLNHMKYLFTYRYLLFLIIFLHILKQTHVLNIKNNIYVKIIKYRSCQITKLVQMLMAFIYICCKHATQTLPRYRKIHEIHNFPLKQNNNYNAR